MVDDTPAGSSSNISTTVLLIVSIVATVSLFLTIPGIPTLVLAILAKVYARSNPSRSRTLTKAGWIVLVALIGVTIAATALDYATRP